MPSLSSIATNSRTPSTLVGMPVRLAMMFGASARASASFMPMRSFASSPGGIDVAAEEVRRQHVVRRVLDEAVALEAVELDLPAGRLARPRDLGLTERIVRDLRRSPRARQAGRARRGPGRSRRCPTTVPPSRRTVSATSLTFGIEDRARRARPCDRARAGRARAASLRRRSCRAGSTSGRAAARRSGRRSRSSRQAQSCTQRARRRTTRTHPR